MTVDTSCDAPYTIRHEKDSALAWQENPQPFLDVHSPASFVPVPVDTGGVMSSEPSPRLRTDHQVRDMSQVARRLLAQARLWRSQSLRSNVVRLQGMQKWEGRVLCFDDETFTAELAPTHQGPTLEADFDRAVIPDSDLELLSEGAIFYMTVRTIGERGGRRTRTSSLRFRRLGAWNEQELLAMKEAASKEVASFDQFVD